MEEVSGLWKKSPTGVAKMNSRTPETSRAPVPTSVCFNILITGFTCMYLLSQKLTLEGLKLAAAIGTPRAMNVVNQRPPSRTKNGPGLNSAHEYKVSSFKEEYSFTCQRHEIISLKAKFLCNPKS